MAMTLADTIDQLESAAEEIDAWQNDYFPDDGDSSRCFEFAVMFDVVRQIETALAGQFKPRVVEGEKERFAGAPADRTLYNYVVVGPYHVYLGVCFAGQSKLAHAPDVVVAHETDPSRPLLVLECKHYSGETLPKPIVMAFVGLLCDLLWAVYRECVKLNPGGLYPGNTLRELSVPAGGDLCEAFNMCKSQLVTTIRPSAPTKLLESRYEFEVVVQQRWKPSVGGAAPAVAVGAGST